MHINLFRILTNSFLIIISFIMIQHPIIHYYFISFIHLNHLIMTSLPIHYYSILFQTSISVLSSFMYLLSLQTNEIILLKMPNIVILFQLICIYEHFDLCH
jgi:hypothetical protein